MFILPFILLSCIISTYLFLPLLHKYGYVSRDTHKLKPYTLIPEPGSIPACLIYILAIFYFSSDKKESIPVVISITLGLVIGLIDDLISLSWGAKIILPIVTWMPSRYCYSRPNYLRLRIFKYIDFNLPVIGPVIIVWEVITLCLFIFIPNAINIYAGLNGLEVGQSLIICLAIYGFGNSESNVKVEYYMFYFIPICLSLLMFNWYPAKMFVGDTFTSFAGSLFANIYIIGYDPIKLIVFLLPQIVNFLVSIPQLIGLLPCPRHRTPNIQNSGLLSSNNNLTLINLVLKLVGPMKERDLVGLLLLVQALVAITTHLIVY